MHNTVETSVEIEYQTLYNVFSCCCCCCCQSDGMIIDEWYPNNVGDGKRKPPSLFENSLEFRKDGKVGNAETVAGFPKNMLT